MQIIVYIDKKVGLNKNKIFIKQTVKTVHFINIDIITRAQDYLSFIPC